MCVGGPQMVGDLGRKTKLSCCTGTISNNFTQDTDQDSSLAQVVSGVDWLSRPSLPLPLGWDWCVREKRKVTRKARKFGCGSRRAHGRPPLWRRRAQGPRPVFVLAPLLPLLGRLRIAVRSNALDVPRRIPVRRQRCCQLACATAEYQGHGVFLVAGPVC